MPKSSSMRVRAFRAKKRAGKPPKQPPKSGAQRSRECRARQKALRNANATRVPLPIPEIPTTDTLRYTSDPSTSNDASTSTMCHFSNPNQQNTNYRTNQNTHKEFKKIFFDNPSGFVCGSWDPVWFNDDLSNISEAHQQLLYTAFPEADVNNSMTYKCCIQSLSLSETLVQNEERRVVSNFYCIVKYKHPVVKTNRVVYHNSTGTTTAITAHMDFTSNKMNALSVNTTAVGEICTARCTVGSNQTILVVVVYISPNKRISDMIDFIYEVLLVYTPEGAALLNKRWDKIPIILSGDFNVNFAKPEAQSLIDFLNNKFNLKLNNDRTTSTTRSQTTNDTVFCRYLDELQPRTYVLYFSYHKPTILSYKRHSDSVLKE